MGFEEFTMIVLWAFGGNEAVENYIYKRNRIINKFNVARILKELENEPQEHERQIDRMENDAKARLSAQKQENDASIRSLKFEMQKKEENFKIEQKTLVREHILLMESRKTESVEKRLADVMEHVKNLKELKQKMEHERDNIANQISEAETNGKQEVEALEKELEQVSKDREELRKQYEADMKDIQEVQDFFLKEIQNHNSTLKNENAEEQRLHQQAEHDMVIDALSTNISRLTLEFQHQSTFRIFKELSRVMDPVCDMNYRLMNTRFTFPVDEHDELPEQGVLETDCKIILEEIDKFRGRKKGFEQFVMAENDLDPKFVAVFLDITQKLDTLMEHPDLHLICSKMNKDSASKNRKKLIELGKSIDSFNEKYRTTKQGISDDVQKILKSEDLKQIDN